jgi:uncharacterized membrane protein
VRGGRVKALDWCYWCYCCCWVFELAFIGFVLVVIGFHWCFIGSQSFSLVFIGFHLLWLGSHVLSLVSIGFQSFS